MSSKYYIKHLIECQCILKLYEKNTVPIYHKFPVFSEVDEAGNVKEKYASCNNCQIIHKVTGPFTSVIQWGKEGIKSYVKTIDDVKFNLDIPQKIIDVLDREKVDISTWEQLEFIVENKLENEIIKIKEEDLGETKSFKFLEYNNGKFKLKTENMQKDITLR
jgi:hypothetical protein